MSQESHWAPGLRSAIDAALRATEGQSKEAQRQAVYNAWPTELGKRDGEPYRVWKAILKSRGLDWHKPGYVKPPPKSAQWKLYCQLRDGQNVPPITKAAKRR